jgi:hypothetical protein
VTGRGDNPVLCCIMKRTTATEHRQRFLLVQLFSEEMKESESKKKGGLEDGSAAGTVLVSDYNFTMTGELSVSSRFDGHDSTSSLSPPFLHFIEKTLQAREMDRTDAKCE